MFLEEIRNNWDAVFDKTDWGAYKSWTSSTEPIKAIVSLEDMPDYIFNIPNKPKTFDELVDEGKTFKEINKIMKGK